MKKVCIFLFITALTASMISCGGAAENKAANTANANAKPAAPAAPTTDALMDMEKKANEAYVKGDGTYFEGILSDKMMMSMGKEHMNKAAVVAMIKTAKCEMTGDVKLSEPQMSKIDNDTYVFTYKNDSTGKCSEHGKMVDMKPMRASTIWIRNGDKWQAAWHGETIIVEPKGDAKKDEAKKDDAKAADVAKDTAKDVVKKEEPKKEEAKKPEAKKEEAKKDEPKKDEAKKEEAKKDDKTAANSAPAEAPKADANTDALTKLHQSGWEAWRDKDAAKLTALSASTLAFVDAGGGWFGTKDETIKRWTTMDCKDVKNVRVTDGFAFALSPTVEVFMHKGTADGSCMGQKNGTLDATAVYVKEGNDWKLAFLFESPASKM